MVKLTFEYELSSLRLSTFLFFVPCFPKVLPGTSLKTYNSPCGISKPLWNVKSKPSFSLYYMILTKFFPVVQSNFFVYNPKCVLLNIWRNSLWVLFSGRWAKILGWCKTRQASYYRHFLFSFFHFLFR